MRRRTALGSCQCVPYPWLTSSLLSPVFDPGCLVGMAGCHCENNRRKPAYSQMLLTCLPEAPSLFPKGGTCGLTTGPYVLHTCPVPIICINCLCQECSAEEKYSYDVSKNQKSLKEQTVIKKKEQKQKNARLLVLERLKLLNFIQNIQWKILMYISQNEKSGVIRKVKRKPSVGYMFVCKKLPT